MRPAHAFATLLRWTGRALAVVLVAVGLFALANLAATAALLVREHQAERLYTDAARLWVANGRAQGDRAERRFARLYGSSLGRNPDPARLKAWLEQQGGAGGPIVLDEVLADYVLTRWGRVDGRVLPPGVYFGARALGPDTAALSRWTEYLAQYLFFPRHGYVLIVPPADDPAGSTEFSASWAKDFSAHPAHPNQLMIKAEPFAPGAYDFPAAGQAVHELFRLSSDPEVARRTRPELQGLAGAVGDTDARYELFRQNSNTVLGCMLRASDLQRANFERFRRDPLYRLRLLGIGEPLWSHPGQRPAGSRCR